MLVLREAAWQPVRGLEPWTQWNRGGCHRIRSQRPLGGCWGWSQVKSHSSLVPALRLPWLAVRGLLKKAVVQMLEGVQGTPCCSIHLSAFRGRKRKGLTTNVCVLVIQLPLALSIPGTVACQTPLSMGSSRQEHWSGLLFSSPGDLPNPGIEPRSLALQVNSLPYEPLGKSDNYSVYL